MIRAGLALVGAAFALALFTVVMALQNRAWGQSGHAENHDIYKNWHPPSNPATSCCNDQDCRPTPAYLDEDGIWHAWNGTLWLLVPPDRVLPTDYAGDGRSHLCESGSFVYCFSPGEPKS